MCLLFITMIAVSGCKSSSASKPSSTVLSKQDPTQRQMPLLFGRVKDIIGNEVTLELTEMPQTNRNNQLTDEERQKRIAQRQSENGGQWAAGEIGFRDRSDRVTQGQQRMNNLKFTGETKNITLPVGIPIKGMGRNSEDIEIGDITKGTLIQIFGKQGNGADITIESVRVMQSEE